MNKKTNSKIPYGLKRFIKNIKIEQFYKHELLYFKNNYIINLYSWVDSDYGVVMFNIEIENREIMLTKVVESEMSGFLNVKQKVLEDLEEFYGKERY